MDRETTPDIIRLREFLPYRLSVLTNLISEKIAAHYRDSFDLTIPEWRVIATLAERPDLSVGEISENIAMSYVKVSRALARLEKRGRIERTIAEDDRRRSLQRLTPEGERIYAEIVPVARRYERLILDSLDPGEAKALDALLAKLTRLARTL